MYWIAGVVGERQYWGLMSPQNLPLVVIQWDGLHQSIDTSLKPGETWASYFYRTQLEATQQNTALSLSQAA
jgi:hypothetical protein